MKEAFRTAWPYLIRYRTRWGVGFAALVAKDLCGVGLPLVLRQGVDRLTQGFALETVLWLAASLVGLSVVKGLFQYAMRVVLVNLSREVEYDLRNDIYRKLTSLSHDFYARFRTGDIMARATNDLNAVRMMLGPGVMYLGETSLTFVLALTVMLSTDWVLTLLALLPAPLVSLVVIVFGQRIHKRFEKIQELFSDISSRVQENLAGVRVLRAYVQEEAELARFARLNEHYIGENLKLARLMGLFYPLLQALVGLTFLMVLWVGGHRVMAGKISLGSFVMFNTYLGMLVWPMIAFGWVTNLVQRGTASMARIKEILDQAPAIAAPPKPRAMPEKIEEISFEDVRLDWGTRAAIRGISLKIRAGETVAIVGRTGSGKSSLVQMLPRLVDPTAGAVKINGVDLREFEPAETRKRIGFVPQETFLFSDTLAGNIAFGAAEASREKIERAARIAGLEADIAGFPQGYETMVGERGITLSGGQKQRTAIARALLRNPEILVLDDALASVDTVTEDRILQSLRGVFEGRITVLISHRVSTVRQANRIYVLDEGQVLEEGTHDELVARGGAYAELHQKQLLEEELEAL